MRLLPLLLTKDWLLFSLLGLYYFHDIPMHLNKRRLMPAKPIHVTRTDQSSLLFVLVAVGELAVEDGELVVSEA